MWSRPGSTSLICKSVSQPWLTSASTQVKRRSNLDKYPHWTWFVNTLWCLCWNGGAAASPPIWLLVMEPTHESDCELNQQIGAHTGSCTGQWQVCCVQTMNSGSVNTKKTGEEFFKVQYCQVSGDFQAQHLRHKYQVVHGEVGNTVFSTVKTLQHFF